MFLTCYLFVWGTLKRSFCSLDCGFEFLFFRTFEFEMSCFDICSTALTVSELYGLYEVYAMNLQFLWAQPMAVRAERAAGVGEGEHFPAQSWLMPLPPAVRRQHEIKVCTGFFCFFFLTDLEYSLLKDVSSKERTTYFSEQRRKSHFLYNKQKCRI